MKMYEGCFILNTAGKEAGIKEMIDAIDKQIRDSGGNILKTQRMDKKPFARVTGPIDSGYYVNFVFEMQPEQIGAFRDKFKLNEDVYRLLISEASKGALENDPVPVSGEAAA